MAAALTLVPHDAAAGPTDLKQLYRDAADVVDVVAATLPPDDLLRMAARQFANALRHQGEREEA
jgi:hypothetical protein